MGAGARVAATAALAASVAAACQSGPDCLPRDATTLNYAEPTSWLCHPDLPDGSNRCHDDPGTVELLADGTITPQTREIAEDPAFDCFYVYPTVDLRLTPQLHQDFRDVEGEVAAVQGQFARMARHCRQFAPLYRQVTVGTYLSEDEQVQTCFDAAYADVERAFDLYLADHNGGRGVLLVGHSQGAQIVSRLLRERFDDDEATRSLLVGAMPIGWPVGTAAGQLTGGSWQSIPLCAGPAEAGCVVAFRSYAVGNEFLTTQPQFAEGEETVCVHPSATASANDEEAFLDAYLNVEVASLANAPDGVDTDVTPVVRYRDYFVAACEERDGQKALAIRAAPAEGDVRDNPSRFDGALLNRTNGLHLVEMQLAVGTLGERAAAMFEAWSSR